MADWKDWFGERRFHSYRDGCQIELTIDGLYKAFKARGEAEAKEKLTECDHIMGHSYIMGDISNGRCLVHKTDVNIPNCSFEYCPDCGEKLE